MTNECGSIFNIYQHYLEAIPTKFDVSIMITSMMLISFAGWPKSLGGKGIGVIYRPPTFLISHIKLLHYIFTILLLPFSSSSISCVHLI